MSLCGTPPAAKTDSHFGFYVKAPPNVEALSRILQTQSDAGTSQLVEPGLTCAADRQGHHMKRRRASFTAVNQSARKEYITVAVFLKL